MASAKACLLQKTAEKELIRSAILRNRQAMARIHRAVPIPLAARLLCLPARRRETRLHPVYKAIDESVADLADARDRNTALIEAARLASLRLDPVRLGEFQDGPDPLVIQRYRDIIRHDNLSALISFASEIEGLVRRRRQKAPPVVSLPQRPIPIVPDRARVVHRRPDLGGSQRLVHLPIPRSEWPRARRLGAVEADAPPGISPFHVTADMDLVPFRDFLPSSLKGPGKYSFPPIHFAAPGQNLWSLFDEPTWDHIRHSSYEGSGYRCTICGERGGFLSKILFPDGTRSGVDCHEVWEWSVFDLSSGIGIQRLVDLLVVCVSCHATFHEGYFVKLADQLGRADLVRDHIAKRRMAMNGYGRDDLDRQLVREAQAAHDLKPIRDWVLDLHYLSTRRFMIDRTPVFITSNAAGIPASMIGGLRFDTDEGHEMAARHAEDIAIEMTASKRRGHARVPAMSFQMSLPLAATADLTDE